MRLQTLTIALLATLAVACVPPRSKSPQKHTPIASPVVDMPDDGLNNATPNNAATNNAATNNAATNNAATNNVVDGPVCGDGLLEGAEECEGAVDVTCEELGFDGGFTACSACRVDSDACTRVTCGDGVVQDDEVCDDGAGNGGYDACSTNCSGLDQYCGDGEANGPEACDGGPPAGTTCRSLGFDGGTIMCGAGCQVDTSNCTTCGDGVVGSGESCDDGGLNGTYGRCNALCSGPGATCGDGLRNGPEDCDGAQLGGATCASLGAGQGTLGCTASCTFNATACSLAPAAGDVVISEIMQNPAISSDNDGEFFELYNTTPNAVDLGGCTIESSTASGPESFTIAGTVLVSGGGYAVFARSLNAPFSADYIYGGSINLNNSVDELAVICPQPGGGGGVEIDRVAYDDGVTFPDPEGASMTLNPNRMNGTENDSGSNWCEASSAFGVGDLGTPGAPNDSCF